MIAANNQASDAAQTERVATKRSVRHLIQMNDELIDINRALLETLDMFNEWMETYRRITLGLAVSLIITAITLCGVLVRNDRDSQAQTPQITATAAEVPVAGR